MNNRNIVAFLLLVMAASAWITWADHPNARNLRQAIRDTLPLL